jgi:ribosome recycling factor
MNEYSNPKVSEEEREEGSKLIRKLNRKSQRALREILQHTLESAKTLKAKKGVLHIFSFSKISEQSFQEAIKNDKLLYRFCLEQI